MHIRHLRRDQVLDGTPGEIFPFFADAANLEAMTPPLLRFRLITPQPITMRPGTLIEYRLRVRGIPLRWQTLIQDWTPCERFVDVQLRGPYALWHHTHEFRELRGGRTLMTDSVRYALGFGPIGELADRVLVARDVAAIFDHRATAIVPLLERLRAG